VLHHYETILDDPIKESKLVLAPHHNLQNQHMYQWKNEPRLFVLPLTYLSCWATEYGTDVDVVVWSSQAS
jgi:hypothetical protein